MVEKKLVVKETPVEEVAPETPALPARMPRIGQGVLYVSDDYSHLEDGRAEGDELPAGVVGVYDDGSVDLRAGNFTAGAVGYDANGAPGTWHYPEKV